MRRGRRAEDHAHPERWLVSYADFMTLMFALFVVLFASAYHDKQAIKKVSDAVKNGFQEMGAFSASNNAPGRAVSVGSRVDSSVSSTEDGRARLNAEPADAGIDVIELHRKLNEALGKEIERQEIVMRGTPEGFVISLRELGFFDSGEARLLPGAEEKIRRIAAVLTKYGLDMRVEGHSDDIPIHNAVFDSNWNLSTARATAVAMMLIDKAGVDPARVSIAGYGQYHPAANNATPEGRKANRRVDIVVVSASRRSDVKAP